MENKYFDEEQISKFYASAREEDGEDGEKSARMYIKLLQDSTIKLSNEMALCIDNFGDEVLLSQMDDDVKKQFVYNVLNDVLISLINSTIGIEELEKRLPQAKEIFKKGKLK